ncbi:MAG: diacylglyceryl transferase [Mycobacterium sp.]|nr:diacylglyceryl transferase [Mycobacterium sp.]
MTTTLAYLPSPPQGVWHLGPVPLRAYALFIIIGIVVALVIGDRRWEARGGERGVIYDIALWAVPFGLIGGRLYHVITDWTTYFGEGGAGVGAALRIWDGGLGIWGAVALGGVGAWIACRRRGIPLPAFGDAIAPGIVLAQAIGRIGNYFNQELYGRETTVPWGLEIFYRRDPSGAIDVHSLDGVSTGQLFQVVHPTFLYELLWNVLVFVMLILVDRRFKFGHGRLFALYVAGYCVGRFWVELMRSDTATHIAGIRVNSFTSTFVFIAAVVYIMVAPKGREDPTSLRGKPRDDEVSGESPVDEVAKELATVAAASGVVAAATVAGQEDTADAKAAGADDKPDPVEEPDSAGAQAPVEEAETAEAAEAGAAAETDGVDLEEAEAEADADDGELAPAGSEAAEDEEAAPALDDEAVQPDPVAAEATDEPAEALSDEELAKSDEVELPEAGADEGSTGAEPEPESEAEATDEPVEAVSGEEVAEAEVTVTPAEAEAKAAESGGAEAAEDELAEATEEAAPALPTDEPAAAEPVEARDEPAEAEADDVSRPGRGPIWRRVRQGRGTGG